MVEVLIRMDNYVVITEKNGIGYRTRRHVQAIAGRIIPNRIMAKLYYRIVMKDRLDLSAPTTFNQKIQWYKLNYCADNDLVIQCSDKYAVREYVAACGYGKYLNGLLGVWDSVEEIDWDKLPRQFVIKCNHGCGYNIICKDKTKLDVKKVDAILRRWMKQDFGLFNIEPHYSKIKKKILCEQYIEPVDQGSLQDYKIFCFNGVPKLIGVYSDRQSSLKRTFFDTEWNIAKVSKKAPEHELAKPRLLDEALSMSRKLSEPFPFVRVDLYDLENTIIFGELTFSPAAGLSRSFSPEGDLRLGELLELPV